MTDSPFGRQPQPVTIHINGEQIDVEYWRNKLMHYVENQGPDVNPIGYGAFRIFPRAVND